MFCPNCGSQITEQDAFCANCGTRVQQEPMSQPAPQPQYAPVVSSNKDMAIAGFVCAFFVPLLGLIFSIIGIKRANENFGTGKGLAVAGVIISSILIFFSIIFMIVFYQIYMYMLEYILQYGAA